MSSDTNGDRDIFVRNRSTNITTRASVSSSGTQANGASDHPAVSPDGRYVGFPSEASNLVSSDTNAAWDVFVKDLTGGTTIRISVGANGQGNSDSPARAWMSDFANQIAFPSEASNLVSGDTNGVQDIFVRDRLASTTERSSVSSSGSQSNGSSDLPSITSDGRYVGYSSDGSNLVSGDTNAARDVFVRDRTSKTTVAASVNSSGQVGNGASDRPMIAGAGRYVVFHSAATNLVASDTNAVTDVFMRDMTSGTTQLVSMGVNRPPTAQLTVTPEQGDTNTTFTASMAGSSDPDGDALAYEIDWGDGTSTQSQTGTHKYSSPGSYTVIGTVTDEFGAIGSTGDDVVVCAVGPLVCDVPETDDPDDDLPPLFPREGSGRARASADACPPGLLPLAGGGCTHGGDPAEATREEYQGPVPRPPCRGDGITGARVQVFYGRPLDRPARLAEARPIIRKLVARADYEMAHSGPAGEPQQHIRWACNKDARVKVKRVNLIGVNDSGAEVDPQTDEVVCFRRVDVEGGPGEPPPKFTMDDLQCSLENQVAWGLGPIDYDFVDDNTDGVNDCLTCDPLVRDRTYSVFLDDGNMVTESGFPDAYDSGSTGEGSVDNEDPRADPGANENNFGPAYALIDAWKGATLLHETMHNLGAVQRDALHSTYGAHCYEEWDVMCYDDTGDGTDGKVLAGNLTEKNYPLPNCPNRPGWKLDCGRDDYWNPFGLIFDVNGEEIWNTANSRFLTTPS